MAECKSSMLEFPSSIPSIKKEKKKKNKKISDIRHYGTFLNELIVRSYYLTRIPSSRPMARC